MERKELLRAWLRGKNYHLLDVKAALDWWERQTAAGACPTDEDVLSIADDSHREAVRKGIAPPEEGSRGAVQEERELYPLDLSEVKPVTGGCSPITVLYGMAGGSLTIILYEGIRWLLTAYR